MLRVVVLGLFFFAAAAPASAAEPKTSIARFAFVPVAGGALRLDTETGEASLCVGGPEAPSCTRVSENVRMTIGERARLEAKVEALETRLATLEANARETATPETGEVAMQRVRTLATRIIDHFVGAVQTVKHDLRGSQL